TASGNHKEDECSEQPESNLEHGGCSLDVESDGRRKAHSVRPVGNVVGGSAGQDRYQSLPRMNPSLGTKTRESVAKLTCGDTVRVLPSIMRTSMPLGLRACSRVGSHCLMLGCT